MSGRLQSLNSVDFTGGLNLRRSQFTLAENESPEMLNIEIDIRGGIRTRRGWQRWNATDIVSTPTSINWAPRSAWTHPLTTGSSLVYLTNDGDLYAAGSNGVFAQVLAGVADPIVVGASPHLADGVSWGDIEYMACGRTNPSIERDGTATYATRLTDAYGNYNDNYTTPASNTMPRCEHLEAHVGYLFAAYTKEGTDFPNRLRWSHPAGFVKDWAEDDYIDLPATGGHITGLVSFRDRLLVFKTDAIFVLFGSGTESFAFEQVPGSYGAPHPQAIGRSAQAVYFYSSSGNNGIYAYVGDEPVHISDKLREAMIDITDESDVWLAWLGRRLWCSLPWKPDGDMTGTQSCLVFDPALGEGSWVLHRAAIGDLTCLVKGSDRGTDLPLAVIEGSSGAACVVRLSSRIDAADAILENATLSDFDVAYRTRWMDAGWPERRKSWRRPRLEFAAPEVATEIWVETFEDYSTDSRRSGTFSLSSKGLWYWRATGSSETDGAEWGDGAIWTGQASGATLERVTTESQGWGLGVNRAIQLLFTTRENSLGNAWGLDLISMKYVLRRFTT